MPAVAAKEKGARPLAVCRHALPDQQRLPATVAAASSHTAALMLHSGQDVDTGRCCASELSRAIAVRAEAGFGVSTLNPAHAALMRRPERYGLRKEPPAGGGRLLHSTFSSEDEIGGDIIFCLHHHHRLCRPCRCLYRCPRWRWRNPRDCSCCRRSCLACPDPG